MDLKRWVYILATLIIAVFIVCFAWVAFINPTVRFDWVPVAYWIWLACNFAIGFGVGYYFWKNATLSNWDAKFRDLVRRQVVEHPQLKAFTDMLPYAHFAPPVANWEQMADAVIRALQQVYTKQAEPEAALKEAAATIDSVLQQ